MVKTLNYTLLENRIIPEEPQCAGLQGEHRATALVFSLDEGLHHAAEQAAAEGNAVVYRIDFITEAGELFRGEERIVEKVSEPFYLTSDMTISGLPSTVIYRLILKKDGAVLNEFYKAQIKLFFEPSPITFFGSSHKNEEAKALSDTAREIYEEIDRRADRVAELIAMKTSDLSKMVGASAEHLKRVIRLAEQTEKTGKTFSEKEFVFMGGDAADSADIELFVDDILSPDSINPLQNRVVAEELLKIEGTIAENKQKAEETHNSLREGLDAVDALAVKRTLVNAASGNSSLMKWCNENVREGLQIIQLGAGITDLPGKSVDLVNALYWCNNVEGGAPNGRRTLMIIGRDGNIYIRHFITGTGDTAYHGWQSWYKFGGAEITVSGDDPANLGG